MGSKVVIYQYDFKKDRDVVVGSIAWDGKKMTSVGTVPGEILSELTEYGIKDYTKKKVVLIFPKDGLSFLKMLKYRYDSAYLRATDVIVNET